MTILKKFDKVPPRYFTILTVKWFKIVIWNIRNTLYISNNNISQGTVSNCQVKTYVKMNFMLKSTKKYFSMRCLCGPGAQNLYITICDLLPLTDIEKIIEKAFNHKNYEAIFQTQNWSKITHSDSCFRFNNPK